jgi:hypothetical protein
MKVMAGETLVDAHRVFSIAHSLTSCGFELFLANEHTPVARNK